MRRPGPGTWAAGREAGAGPGRGAGAGCGAVGAVPAGTGPPCAGPPAAGPSDVVVEIMAQRYGSATRRTPGTAAGTRWGYPDAAGCSRSARTHAGKSTTTGDRNLCGEVALPSDAALYEFLSETVGGLPGLQFADVAVSLQSVKRAGRTAAEE